MGTGSLRSSCQVDWLWTLFKSRSGCAPKMRTNADDDKKILVILTRAVFIPAVVRQRHGERMASRRVCNQWVRLDHICQHSSCPIDEKHRHSAPGNRHHLTRSQRADVRRDWCARCSGFVRWRERLHKRHKRSNTTDASCDRCCNQPFATATVHAICLVGYQFALQSFKAMSI
jgi:hypothetical protein